MVGEEETCWKHVVNKTLQSVILVPSYISGNIIKTPLARRSSVDKVEYKGLTFLGYLRSIQQNNITNVKLQTENRLLCYGISSFHKRDVIDTRLGVLEF